MARKTDKICLVCGEWFKATASGKTCSGACRTAMKRMLDNGRRPDFYLLAKSKGQSVPEVKNLNKQSTGTTKDYKIKAAENESIVVKEPPKDLSKSEMLRWHREHIK